MYMAFMLRHLPSLSPLVPQVSSLTEVSNSFKKLMRACIPSSPQNTFFAAIQDSGWLTQLTHLMQVSGAVADLIDIQGSSVLVCLENGWDATAQVRRWVGWEVRGQDWGAFRQVPLSNQTTWCSCLKNV